MGPHSIRRVYVCVYIVYIVWKGDVMLKNLGQLDQLGWKGLLLNISPLLANMATAPW